MRFFNTEGPVRPEDHYSLPPLSRWDLDAVLMLIDQKKYFLLHAPRQTGKTSCLLALMEHLNRAGRYRTLYANIEGAQTAREDVDRGMAAVCSVLGRSARLYLGDGRLADWYRDGGGAVPADDRFAQLLEFWAAADPRPAVLLLDEVDALVGDTLIALLRQLRAGYTQRPEAFPQTVILCGVRDLRDYRIHAHSETSPITGGSAFNIKAESLRLGDFTAAEVTILLREHTTETGQVFTPATLARVWELTQGQPWLVNALAYHACFRLPAGRDRSQPITLAMIDQAKEHLILNRVTHLDQLAHKLREPRVRRVIEPMLAGTELGSIQEDDIQYLIDLGLLRRDGAGGLVVANPIYREILPRALAFTPQASLPQISPTWLNADGSLNPEHLLDAFLTFWRRHGQPLLGSAPYHEIAPHLVLMAFLHRVINGGGTLEREYAIGSGRMDLSLRYGSVTLGMELKVWRDQAPDPLAEGLKQLDGYLAGLGLDTGWLVIFDRRGGQPPIAERSTSAAITSPAGRRILVVRA
ncbi:MAG: AAA-like domain-containing protein [Chromatiaceae bacterium]|nr:AAA-like domain-containing protein [Chromatiaceae bacterium]MBP6808255.1 AAA-like domain-containing protein [Chromatiaceae bacterium]MBP8289468.1 AAA-like domain-containing protein [Chromatiaceae bacterium]MBP9755013.1 AAA-like domain-containing protein [Phenylobacterium sp.]